MYAGRLGFPSSRDVVPRRPRPPNQIRQGTHAASDEVSALGPTSDLNQLSVEAIDFEPPQPFEVVNTDTKQGIHAHSQPGRRQPFQEVSMNCEQSTCSARLNLTGKAAAVHSSPPTSKCKRQRIDADNIDLQEVYRALLAVKSYGLEAAHQQLLQGIFLKCCRRPVLTLSSSFNKGQSPQLQPQSCVE